MVKEGERTTIKESIAEDLKEKEAFADRLNEELVSYDTMIRKLKDSGRLTE